MARCFDGDDGEALCWIWWQHAADKEEERMISQISWITNPKFNTTMVKKKNGDLTKKMKQTKKNKLTSIYSLARWKTKDNFNFTEEGK